MKRNNTKIIVSIVVLAVVATLLISLLGGLIKVRGTSNWFSVESSSTNNYTLDETQSYYMSEINSIEIDISVYEVRVNYSDDDKVYIKSYNSDGLTTTCKLSDGNLIVKETGRKWWKFFSFFNESAILEINIPKEYSKSILANISAGSINIENGFSLEELNLQGSAGEIKISSEITADIFKCSLSTGSIKIDDNLSAKEATFENQAGEIEINSEINCTNFVANVSTGEIDIESLNASEYSISSSAGSIGIASLSGKGTVTTDLGEIKARIKQIDESAKFKATAGSIDIDVDSSVSFAFEGKKTLGDLSADFQIYSDQNGNYFGQVGNDENTVLSVEVTAGDAKISID